MLLFCAYLLRTQATIDNLTLPDVCICWHTCVLILNKHRSVEARGQFWPSFPSFSTLHFESRSLTGLGAQVTYLGCWPVNSGDPPVSFSQAGRELQMCIQT